MLSLGIVGNFDGTHIGGGFLRAAQSLGLDTTALNAVEASRGNIVLRKVLWHIGGGRPLHLKGFSVKVVAACALHRFDLIVATGTAPLTTSALRALRAMGAVCVNYSTDDPWNKRQYSPWFLSALPEYDIVFTTRRSNLEDFRRLNCRRVEHLPFGYDEWLWQDTDASCTAPAHDVLFVGGAIGIGRCLCATLSVPASKSGWSAGTGNGSRI